MRYVLLFLVIFSTCIYGISLEVLEGSVNDIGNVVISPYAVVKGSIIFKIGNVTWYPEEIWIVPNGTLPENFKFTGKYNELDMGFDNCKVNVYHNSTLGYAYKVTKSNILNGSFCAPISPGDYEVLAK